MVTGSRQRQLADVVLDVEAAVVDPIRVVEAERHRAQAASGTAAADAAAADQLPTIATSSARPVAVGGS